ncbi:TPA_asm: maturation protein [ssRNA phage Gerhypos.3_11]|uniref:Maturation protein n=2 Tax=Leviviricetes TaxID=2842243 RepID=A0A8S5KY80_9VIRU|nr:maturation protein [ssRNA phage Gerhypos.3_11]QDH87341.1 MAG: hypothetical protein H3Bulk41524_000001 [Leviviridae sp.]DAD50377.1 TPA_asm: maturation protein [ssRNA phage Gerhypos.3_11]
MFIDHGSTRKRQLTRPAFFNKVDYTLPGYATPYQFGKVYTDLTKVTRSIDGIQITESDRNRWPPVKGTLEDYGSEFFTQKVEVLGGKLPFTETYIQPGSDPFGAFPARVRSRGNMFIASGFGNGVSANSGFTSVNDRIVPMPQDLSSSRAALVTKGTIAVAACAPQNQLADAASFVGELLQDVPQVPGLHLWSSRLKALEVAAKASGEFLNVVFGVLPTISDMQSFLKAAHKVDKAIDQYVKNAGRPVRRRFRFPKEVTTTTETLAGIYSPLGSNGGGGNVFLGSFSGCYPQYETVRQRTVERETWFSGAFLYHLPDWFDSSSERDRKRLMAQLFGAKPDLDTLWQLTPWSWAVDWFTNASSFVKNVSSLISYGTVLQYGYIMEKTTVTDIYTAGNKVFTPTKTLAENHVNPPYPAVHPLVIRTTVKKRIRANPFGFGISWDGLSPIQLAITAALGITRVVR